MKILIVEDSQKLSANIKEGLEQEGYVVECVYDGEIAEKRVLMGRNDFDLVILDVMLPGKDGISICTVWRENNVMLPIIMLTARDATDDKVRGLDSGADDYLAKPFAFEELVARVRALLRRPAESEKTVLEVGDIILDTVGRTVKQKGKEVVLTLKEYMVLEYLMRNQGKVITRDTLYDHAWDFADAAFSNTVNVHIGNLRRKLHDTHGTIIQTIRGVGYKLEA